MKSTLLLLASTCFCAALLGAGGVMAESSGATVAGGLTPEDVARLQSVTSAVVSPDGAHVAFTRQVPRDWAKEDDGPAWSELLLRPRDGRPMLASSR